MAISKLDAALRLLEEAIRGHLRGDDPLSVHLATFSALRVTADLRRHRDLGQSPIDRFIRPGSERAFWGSFYRVNSFLKHADRDPDELLELPDLFAANEIVLVLVIENCRALGVDVGTRFWLALFYSAFLVAHPEAALEDATPHLDQLMQVWPHLDHGLIVDLARDPEKHRDLLRRLEEVLAPAVRAAPEPAAAAAQE